MLGVPAPQPFNSWDYPRAVAGTAEAIANTLAEGDWIRLSAGEGTKGPRWFEWAYLELANLDPEDLGAPAGLGIWTRGLLVRRRLSDGELAFFTTWCPEGTPVETLVRVEGRRWSIEDAFETAKNELGLDHNETRSWHGWHRHVSLVMLAFALLTVVRHKADALTAPPKTTRKEPYPWSAGRCRRSVALPAASPSARSTPPSSSRGPPGGGAIKLSPGTPTSSTRRNCHASVMGRQTSSPSQ